MFGLQTGSAFGVFQKTQSIKRRIELLLQIMSFGKRQTVAFEKSRTSKTKSRTIQIDSHQQEKVARLRHKPRAIQTNVAQPEWNVRHLWHDQRKVGY
jgi:hypothetical protein